MRFAALWLAALACIALCRSPSAARSQRHLYVTDSYNKAVYRFPVGNDGLPATQPNGMLAGFASPFGVGVDRAGEVFVADTYSIKVFAWSPSGEATLLRALQLRPAYAQVLAVRSDGALFVSVVDRFGNEKIDVFAPGARGSEKPVHIIPFGPSAGPIADVVVDDVGRLYVLPLIVIDEFDRPLTDTAPTNVIYPGRYEFGWGEAMAYDESSNELYANFQPRAEGRGYTDDDYGVRKTGFGTGPPDRFVRTKDCHGPSFNPGQNHGAVISGKYLIFTCLDQGEVLVYRKDGPVLKKLVEAVGRGLLFAPQGIALGP